CTHGKGGALSALLGFTDDMTQVEGQAFLSKQVVGVEVGRASTSPSPQSQTSQRH
ncbi:MAG: hypothetical protein RLZZ17_449, partial [Actinomycetota bacterium]